MPAPKDPIAYALWKKRMSESRTGDKNPNFGKPVSESRKQKQRAAMIGKYEGSNNPMYGIRLTGELNGFYEHHHTEESKTKISLSKKGTSSWNKGLPSPMKGIPRNEETRRKISEGNKNKPKTRLHKEHIRSTKLITTPTGSESPNWKGGITNLNLHIRTLPRYKIKCESVMKSCNYTDQFTGIRGGTLVCHHIIPQNIIIQMYKITTIEEARKCPLLFDPHNLIVMLASAHDRFHNIYGDDKNIYELTPEQIKELYT